MNHLDRRTFLRAAGGGLAAVWAGSFAPISRASLDADPRSDGRPDTLFLTWQRDPTTTMTVQWLGAGSATQETTVAFAVKGRNDWQSVTPRTNRFPMTEQSVCRAELTGLLPGTEYEFRIGAVANTHRFRTMPAKATDAFQFVSGGDCGANPHAVANNINAARQDPMFALIGGDLAYDNGRSVATNLQFMRNYSQHMIDSQGRLIPMVVCIGNHEVNGGYNQPRSAAPFFFAWHDGLFAEKSFASLDFGDYLSLVLLDTGHVAPIAGEQTDWLGATLRDRAERPHVIVANHVPAYPSFRPYDGTGRDNRKHWVPLFERHQVDLVLEHHDHLFKRTHRLKDGLVDPNGVLYLGDGSWGQLRAKRGPEARPYLATVGDSYHLTLHRLEGEQRFHMAINESGKVVDVCSSIKRPKRRSPA